MPRKSINLSAKPTIDRNISSQSEDFVAEESIDRFSPIITSVSPEPPTTDRLIHILVVETDPVSQSGLVICLNRFPDLQISAQAETTAAGLRILSDDRGDTSEIDVMLLGLPVYHAESQLSGIDFCRTVKATYPDLPILLLADPTDPDLQIAVQIGIEGCCARGSSILDLVGCLRQVAAGQNSWDSSTIQYFSPPSQFGNSLAQNLRASSLQQIESALATLTADLNSRQISPLEQLILTGRRRELNAARWLIKRLFSAPQPPNFGSIEPPNPPVNSSASQPLATTQPSAITAKQVQAEIFDRIAAKLQFNLDNLTSTPLETDILRLEKKRELFYLILRQIEGLLDELRFSQVRIDQLPAKEEVIWQDLWASVTIEFFGRYYTPIGKDRQTEIIPTLLQDRAIVQTEILAKIPQKIELLNHLLFQQPLQIDYTAYAIGTQLAQDRAGELLENLAICLANAVIQPLLNHFGDLDSIKHGFYDRRLLSSREIERFRNDLSWRYRIDRYFSQPQAIFDSQYRLFILTNYGIEQIRIYAPRPEELAQLAGIPLAVTLALETRDAIAPRLKSATALIGTGIVYLLTEIIGRGIGLIGRGIIKGIGNIWQETNRSRKE